MDFPEYEYSENPTGNQEFDYFERCVQAVGKQEFRRTDFGSRLLAAEG